MILPLCLFDRRLELEKKKRFIFLSSNPICPTTPKEVSLEKKTKCATTRPALSFGGFDLQLQLLFSEPQALSIDQRRLTDASAGGGIRETAIKLTFWRIGGTLLTRGRVKTETRAVNKSTKYTHRNRYIVLDSETKQYTQEAQNSSGCYSVAIGRLRSSALEHPFSLACYCVAVFLRAAFRSVGLRACTSVWVAAQCPSRSDSYATFALVSVIYSGYPAVCTPSPRTVSAPRERSRRFTLQIPIAILVILRILHA
ncbi:hypothetical protein EVAR_52710_1 [Eumeta japonica]|uniref:Uncharacterized protein n=1 Tax=Eumeta variegata TaxID=151549 RepID=A0A4C1Y4H4_EUMVA|nr:hypothetical protein EVAR_52710_1 [Eumeta japonica]